MLWCCNGTFNSGCLPVVIWVSSLWTFILDFQPLSSIWQLPCLSTCVLLYNFSLLPYYFSSSFLAFSWVHISLYIICSSRVQFWYISINPHPHCSHFKMCAGEWKRGVLSLVLVPTYFDTENELEPVTHIHFTLMATTMNVGRDHSQEKSIRDYRLHNKIE